MSKIVLILVAVAVAAQAYPRPSDISDAIGKRDWDRLHKLLADLHRREFHNNQLTPITPIRFHQPIAVQQSATPQAQAFAGVGSVSPHSVGSGLAASFSSRTDSAGHTTLQHQEHGFLNDGNTLKLF